MQKTFHVTTSSIYPLGVCFVSEGLHVSAVCEQKADCGIILYDKRHKEGVKIPFPEDGRKGKIHSMLLKGYYDRNCSYLFYQGEELFQDPYAQALINERKYGEKKEYPSRCKVAMHEYAWEKDKAPAIPFEESIFYILHVRGFTKHRSSGVHAKGTYAGIVEKIPYLKELGITAVLLMPSYEFDEVFHSERLPGQETSAVFSPDFFEKEELTDRVNYWGYQEGLYFMPKYTYAKSKDAVSEFKDMVKALHQNGIEIMMQFYFPPNISRVKILEILKYWVLEYHVDGFQLMGIGIPMRMLCEEPLFAEIKLLGDWNQAFPAASNIGGKEQAQEYRNYGVMSDAFLYDIRKLLKGDADMIGRLIFLCKENAVDRGIVNAIARQDGFRLADLVSYDTKHNEANGEFNQDGNDYNYSWNCGIEGKSRKKNILALRTKQMKNALTFVFLSQGTPMLYGGDEFANSQDGNNNPYCQDNPAGWIKWDLSKQGEELLSYTKELIRLRKKYSVLHSRMPLRSIDYLICGYPDISFHGRDAWRPETGSNSRSLGILYCCRYGKPAEEDEDDFLYIGINMYWEPYTFGLPQMPKGKEWIRLFTTDEQAMEEEGEEAPYNILVPPRTIVIYGTKDVQAEMKSRRNPEARSGLGQKQKLKPEKE